MQQIGDSHLENVIIKGKVKLPEDTANISRVIKGQFCFVFSPVDIIDIPMFYPRARVAHPHR